MSELVLAAAKTWPEVADDAIVFALLALFLWLMFRD